MASVIDRLPENIRNEAQWALESRAQTRERQFNQSERELRDQSAAAGNSDPAHLAEALSALDFQRSQQNFQDQVSTWLPLIKKHDPQAIGDLRNELIATFPQISPGEQQRYMDSRMATFEHFVGGDD